jgi:hypothetical protein
MNSLFQCSPSLEGDVVEIESATRFRVSFVKLVPTTYQFVIYDTVNVRDSEICFCFAGYE